MKYAFGIFLLPEKKLSIGNNLEGIINITGE